MTIVRGCHFLPWAVLFTLIALALTQSEISITESPKSSLYEGSQQFALNFFKNVSQVVDSDPNVTTTNIIVSPLSVWSLLALITEGASGNTLSELLHVLNVHDQNEIKYNYKKLQETINVNTSEVKISSSQFIFTDINRPVHRDFDSNIDRYYGEQLLEALDFSSSPEAIKQSYDRINQIVASATEGQIMKAVHPNDIIQARMVILSVLFFKGEWTLPFNRTLTTPTPFYDENERKVGNVQMMYQKAVFPFAAFRELEAQVVELPYGSDRHLSMMLILPRKGVSLQNVIRRLADFNMETIYQELKQAAIEYEDDEVEVYLPRFEITADYNLIPVLQDMGIRDALNKDTANFNKIANDIFLGSVIQKCKIVVNEEGTTAAAVTAAVFANKATPPRFFANRPFAFLIVDKRYDLILFMGQVKDPHSV
ncbi:serine protease inhibitor 77Ba-like [Malaya genurostris]|uniref:serine protease inhibitor 77Ba-like n=1 Tax=Malaya genurostris TaxID=325434 RepID=UPI0026F3D513|nr:serine protease inhibitor 77Ba-like [Malaya genurostris]